MRLLFSCLHDFVLHSLYVTILVMFLAAAHSYIFLRLLYTECLVNASEQVFNPEVWRVINAYNNNNN